MSEYAQEDADPSVFADQVPQPTGPLDPAAHAGLPGVEPPTGPAETAPLPAAEPPAESSEPRLLLAAPEAPASRDDAVPQPRPPLLGLTRAEMNWATAAHASILVTLVLGLGSGGLAALLGVIIPAAIWYAHRDRSEYVVDQARQATIFQIAGIAAFLLLAVGGTLGIIVIWIAAAILVLVLVGLLLLPVALLVTIVWVVALVLLPFAQTGYGIYAAVEAYHGRPFRYRWIDDLIERYRAQS